MQYEDREAEYWLRGYFHIPGEPDEPPRTTPKRWKNLDFMRLRDVALQLVDPRPGNRILDVGCANGPTMIYCGLQGAEVFGQDLDPARVAAANEQLRKYAISGEARVGDATALTFPKGHFDAVISSDFVEHIEESTKIQMFKEACRVLRPGGVLVTKTPNLAYLQLSLFYKRLQAVRKLQNPLRLRIPHTPGTEDPQHIGLTTRWGLTRCLVAAGFYNYEFFYAPLRRFGLSPAVEIFSTEVPIVRDLLCEDLFCRATKPIALSHFPD
jgi:SAM-dependent methyltransferase